MNPKLLVLFRDEAKRSMRPDSLEYRQLQVEASAMHATDTVTGITRLLYAGFNERSPEIRRRTLEKILGTAMILALRVGRKLGPGDKILVDKH